jgi:hypothetical protein
MNPNPNHHHNHLNPNLNNMNFNNNSNNNMNPNNSSNNSQPLYLSSSSSALVIASAPAAAPTDTLLLENGASAELIAAWQRIGQLEHEIAYPTSAEYPIHMRLPHSALQGKKQKSTKKNEQPHVVIKISPHGKGQAKKWNNNALQVIGIYPTRDSAEGKVADLMAQFSKQGQQSVWASPFETTFPDEYDFVVRHAAECVLNLN